MSFVSLLEHCQQSDLMFLSTLLESPLPWVNNRYRKQLLEDSLKSESARFELLSVIDTQVRYFASSEVGYWQRWLRRGDGGVPAEVLVNDAARKLQVKLKIGGSLETRLLHLVSKVVEKELMQQSAEELARALAGAIPGTQRDEELLNFLRRNGKVAVLPALISFLGTRVTVEIIEVIIAGLIEQIVGKQTARELIKTALSRSPILHSLGPLVWTLSGIWIFSDLQGPAYRKTIPFCLYLGAVLHRKNDGLSLGHHGVQVSAWQTDVG